MVGARGLSLATFVWIAIAVAAIVALWAFPGFLAAPSQCPRSVSVGGTVYCSETVRATPPPPGPCPGPCLLQVPLTFFGAAFWLHLTNGTDGPTLTAYASDGNTTYRYLVWANTFGSPWLNWTSPNGALLIQWHAPFLSQWPGVAAGANITCGVADVWILTH